MASCDNWIQRLKIFAFSRSKGWPPKSNYLSKSKSSLLSPPPTSPLSLINSNTTSLSIRKPSLSFLQHLYVLCALSIRKTIAFLSPTSLRSLSIQTHFSPFIYFSLETSLSIFSFSIPKHVSLPPSSLPSLYHQPQHASILLSLYQNLSLYDSTPSVTSLPIFSLYTSLSIFSLSIPPKT